MPELVDDLTGLVEHITTAATVDPVSALLVLAGSLIIAGSVLVAAWLGLGAVAEAARSAV